MEDTEKVITGLRVGKNKLTIFLSGEKQAPKEQAKEFAKLRRRWFQLWKPRIKFIKIKE